MTSNAPTPDDPSESTFEEETDIFAPNESLRAQLHQMRTELGRLTPKQLADGSWFHVTLERAAQRFVKRQTVRSDLSPWVDRYPELSEHHLGHRIIKAACRRSALIGGLAGASITAVEFAALGSGALPIGGAFAIAFAEMALLERTQVDMVFTLAQLNERPLGHTDLREVGALYGEVLKVKGTTRAASYTRQGAVALFRNLGIKFVQRAAIKYALPVVSVGVGGGMNYLMTRALGRHSLRKFERAKQTTARLERAIHHDAALRQLLVGLMALMAGIDGNVDKRERELLRQMLDQMATDPDERAQLLCAINAPEETVFDSLKTVGDDEFHEVVLELLALMAVADGKISPEELRLLARVSAACNLPFDEAELRARYAEFLKDTRRWRRS